MTNKIYQEWVEQNKPLFFIGVGFVFAFILFMLTMR